MSLVKTFEREFNRMKLKGWPSIYVWVDIHQTMIYPNYEVGNIPKEFYPYAKETMQLLSKQKEISLILYTCSHPHEIIEYLEYFKQNNINFKYVNENPEVKTQEGEYGCYDKKPYMNILIEDKAGFIADSDWEPILNYLKNK